MSRRHSASIREPARRLDFAGRGCEPEVVAAIVCPDERSGRGWWLLPIAANVERLQESIKKWDADKRRYRLEVDGANMEVAYAAQGFVEQLVELDDQDLAKVVISHLFRALAITRRQGSGLLYPVKFKPLDVAPTVRSRALNLCALTCLTTGVPVSLEAQGTWCPLVAL